jgi:hypothetical protein
MEYVGNIIIVAFIIGISSCYKGLLAFKPMLLFSFFILNWLKECQALV